MGKGVCSRRQRKIFQSFLLITVICGSMYAFMISYEMHKQLKKTEAMALKYQQHQESLSAQLQVVYEHRSRLEKSLQKERMEHKKAKDDHLAYKLESEQLLTKEKQESNNRFNALQGQHQILKSQHEDLKKQYYELQEQHQNQGENHERVLDEHREQIDHLQRTKEMEISRLKENVYNLKEENRQLRKAHQDIRTQLLDQQHKDLRTANDQLKLTVEDHKSALAVAKLEVVELQRLKGQSPSTTQAVLHSHRADPPHIQSHGLEVPELKPSPHTQPGHTTTQAHTPVASNKEKVEPEVSHHILPDVVDVENDKKQTVKPKQLSAKEEANDEKGEGREKTSFQRWRSRLEHHGVLDGDPGKKLLSSPEEHERKDGLNRQKRQPEILNPDIVLEDSHPRHKDRDEVEDIRIPAKDLNDDDVLNPAEDPNNQGEDEFEVQQQQQDELVRAEPAARRPTGSQERVAQEEQLVMAGSPDQQEDNLDDQYEEAEEEQAGDDMGEDNQAKEEEGGNEDPYSEENAEQGPWNEDIQDQDRDHKEEEYKEDVEIVEEDEGHKEIHTNRRAEM
ncbi:Golgi integral membrane protein 4b isoform X5 [Sardina pilchardus]|uniref:Golgi integral membrane protein 4b isoform X5 n=1 Tax=Sardina pilchardus TaxID=27697 RepID=UPI002E10BB53